jgi:acetyl-CoA carboxylase biotin carboxylase subunit
VLLKAAMGGGGKGMRVATDERSLRRLFDVTRSEAEAAFGSGTVYLERYLAAPRHVEVQIAGDGEGGAIHVGERDCSLQRRHQKLVEEALAPALSGDLRTRIREAAVRLASHARYRTVGTVEFLVEGDEFFFLEVNPRLQVEHPVTEEVTGIDLAHLQIELATGAGLPLSQDEVTVQGHAIEVRVNAEHPWTFLPSPGRVTGYHAPGGPGVRIDSAVHEGAVVHPHYDSLVAKLIVRASTRKEAIRRCLWALDQFVVEGVHTTIPMQRALVASPEFARVDFHTRFVDGFVAERG